MHFANHPLPSKKAVALSPFCLLQVSFPSSSVRESDKASHWHRGRLQECKDRRNSLLTKVMGQAILTPEVPERPPIL